MIRSDSLDQLCSHLEGMPAQWENIHNRFLELPFSSKKKGFFAEQYTQFFSEIHLDISLESIADTHPEIGISFRPLSDYASRNEESDFRLYYNKNKRIEAFSQRRGVLWEYDQLLLVDEKPVVFEMKLRRSDCGKVRTRSRKGQGVIKEKGSSVKYNIRPDFYRRKLYPVRHFFGGDVGYVMLICQEQAQKIHRSPEGSYAHQFLENGGNVVGLYTNRLSFQEQVREKVHEFGLKLR